MPHRDAGYFGPQSVAWRLHADPSMLLGGLRALLVHALHPLVIAGVEQHSGYRNDPWGRLQRTVDFVMATTYGDRAEAERASATVRAVHERVQGVDPVTGAAYRASDPELLLFVHNVEIHSFLVAYRRFGGSLSAGDADRYVAEMATVAELVGVKAGDAPVTLEGLRDWLRSLDGLRVTPGARRVLRMTLVPPVPLPLLPLGGMLGAAAAGLLPRRLRTLYGLPSFLPADAAVHLPAQALVRAARLLPPRHPAVQDARRWARAAA